LGYCGACGAAITVVGRRIELRSTLHTLSSQDHSGSIDPLTNCDLPTPSSYTTTTNNKSFSSASLQGEEEEKENTSKEIDIVPTILIGTISLMPADAEHGMFRSETMKLLRKLRPTIMRWPGGNFVSGYNWVK
jgi:hypothetical protein